jgi:hypothetical protein
MPSQAIALLIRVSAKQYAIAARQRQNGNPNANPLVVSLFEQGEYLLSNYDAGRITLTHSASGRQYTGSMPVILSDYLAGFHDGRRVIEDHEFELVLMSAND